MDRELFKIMIANQQLWKQQYYADKRKRILIRNICNRRCESKGLKTNTEIIDMLNQLSFIEEIQLIEFDNGSLHFETICYK